MIILSLVTNQKKVSKSHQTLCAKCFGFTIGCYTGHCIGDRPLYVIKTIDAHGYCANWGNMMSLSKMVGAK